jgi:heme-degrading monooxygenase HmoA
MMVFINRFEVHGSPADFERLFRDTSDFFRRQPGFLSFRLVRSIQHRNSYVNIAEWESADHLRQATSLPEFIEHSAALRAIATTSPDMHEPVYEVAEAVAP